MSRPTKSSGRFTRAALTWAGSSLVLLMASACASGEADAPEPADVIGFAPGEDFKLANYAPIAEYFEALAAASDRMRLEQIGESTRGVPLYLAAISTPELEQGAGGAMAQERQSVRRSREKRCNELKGFGLPAAETLLKAWPCARRGVRRRAAVRGGAGRLPVAAPGAASIGQPLSRVPLLSQSPHKPGPVLPLRRDRCDQPMKF